MTPGQRGALDRARGGWWWHSVGVRKSEKVTARPLERRNRTYEKESDREKKGLPTVKGNVRGKKSVTFQTKGRRPRRNTNRARKLIKSLPGNKFFRGGAS